MTTKRKIQLWALVLTTLFIAYSLESAWYNHAMQLNFRIITDYELYGGIPSPCGNEEFAALAREFVGLETLEEQEQFINRLAQPASRGRYIFCQETLAGIQRHIDAKIAESLTEQTYMFLISQFRQGLLRDQSNHMMRQSALLMVIADLPGGPITLSMTHERDWGERVIVTAQNREIHISPAFFGGVLITWRIGPDARETLRDMPGRQAWRFEESFREFLSDKTRLGFYYRSIGLLTVYIHDVSWDTGINGSWTARSWPSPSVSVLADALNTILDSRTDSEIEARFVWTDFLQNPMVALETYRQLSSWEIGRLSQQLRIYIDERR